MRPGIKLRLLSISNEGRRRTFYAGPATCWASPAGACYNASGYAFSSKQQDSL